MFRKMSLVGLMIILSANAALCAFIAPDSVLGGFTKCAIKYWSMKGEDKENSNFLNTEALYNQNGKILTEVTIYQDGTPKQSMNYQYDEKGNIEQFSVFDDKGILSIKKENIRSNDTLEGIMYKYKDGAEEKVWKTLIIIEPNTQLEHSTMTDTGEDYLNYMTFSLTHGNSKTISFQEQIPIQYRIVNALDTIIYKYDAAGRIIETLRTDPDGQKSTTFNNYDKNGRLLETSVLKSDGTKEVETYYKYEDDGSKTEFEKNIYGTIYLRLITRYDEQGRVYEREEFHPSGQRRSILSRKFDENNRIIEVTQTNPDDTKVGKRTFEYDKFGNRIKNVEYSPTNEVVKTVEYVYSK